MARVILTIQLIVLLNVLAGCSGIDSGKAQLLPAGESVSRAEKIKAATAAETDIIEQMAVNRKAYRAGLELLIEHYKKTGNNMKLVWAKKELTALDNIPQYNYIIEANIAGLGLRASTAIAEADELYYQAYALEQKAKRFIIIKDDGLLRQALDKYNQLIRKHPASDKIGYAAYRAAGIYEYFKDYSIALLYYQRAYQWDEDIAYPAQYKAAYILDKRLHRRAEALALYQQAVKKENLSNNHREFAEKRIIELTKSDERLEENK